MKVRGSTFVRAGCLKKKPSSSPSPFRQERSDPAVVVLCRLLFACERAAEFLHPSRKTMAVLLAPHDRLAGDPVKLNDAAWTGERLMTVPRVTAATERQQGSFGRRHFENRIVQIVSGTEQSKPATSRLPPRIHIDEDRDDFRL